MAKRKDALVASTVASLDGFRKLSANRRRVALGEQTVEWASRHGVSCIILPAGYLRAKGDSDIRVVSRPLVTAAQDFGIAIVIGVDTCTDNDSSKVVQSEHARSKRKKNSLPYHAVVWAPNDQTHVWRQRSTTSKDWNVDKSLVTQKREIKLGQRALSLLMCGESFNPILRDRIVNQIFPDLVVVPVHSAAGMRHHHAFQFFARHGIPMVRSVHAWGHAKNELVKAQNKTAEVATEGQWRDRDSWIKARAFNL
jgi:hypothetical protein